VSPSVAASRASLLEKALSDGIGSLRRRERTILISDCDLVAELHRRVWRLPDHQLDAWLRQTE
jgi:membrane glycosyltransferase